MDTIFEISSLENPRVPNFIKKSDNFCFWTHPQKHKLFG